MACTVYMCIYIYIDIKYMVNTVTADMREGEAMNKEHSVRHLDSRCDSYLDEFVVELYLFEAL